jgi:hypothetical protein
MRTRAGEGDAASVRLAESRKSKYRTPNKANELNTALSLKRNINSSYKDRGTRYTHAPIFEYKRSLLIYTALIQTTVT